jgi:hypothetical protein
MAETAGKDEGHEQPQDAGKGNVFAAQHEIGQHAGNRHIGSKDGRIGNDVQVAVGRRPIAAVPAGHEAVGVEEPGQKLQHARSPEKEPKTGNSRVAAQSRLEQRA